MRGTGGRALLSSSELGPASEPSARRRDVEGPELPNKGGGRTSRLSEKDDILSEVVIEDRHQYEH